MINAENICIRDDAKLVNYGNDLNLGNYAILGEYKSTERALEVLGEIENILKPIYQVKNELKKNELTGNFKWETTQEYISINCKVYEMPKE